MTRYRHWWWFAAVMLVVGCGSLRPVAEGRLHPEAQILAGVPFVAQQDRYDCGAAALAVLLGHAGRDVPREEIQTATYMPVLRGTLLPDLENYARRLGLATVSGWGGTDLLRQRLEAGYPILIPLELGWGGVSQPHYVVVVGQDRGGFFLRPGNRPLAYITETELAKRWSKMNHLYLYLP